MKNAFEYQIAKLNSHKLKLNSFDIKCLMCFKCFRFNLFLTTLQHLPAFGASEGQLLGEFISLC